MYLLQNVELREQQQETQLEPGDVLLFRETGRGKKKHMVIRIRRGENLVRAFNSEEPLTIELPEGAVPTREAALSIAQSAGFDDVEQIDSRCYSYRLILHEEQPEPASHRDQQPTANTATRRCRG